METATQRFKQSHVLVPVFFLATGALTLLAAGGAYTLENMNYIAKLCFTVGAVMAVLSIVYSLAMTFGLPYVKQFCKAKMERDLQTASLVSETGTVEEGLSATSEEVQAADGDGIAFGPKRRRKVKEDASELLIREVKKDSLRESDAHGLVEPQPPQSRIDLSTRRSSRTTKMGFMGQSMEIGEQDESENLERAAELFTGRGNFRPTGAHEEITVSSKEGV